MLTGGTLIANGPYYLSMSPKDRQQDSVNVLIFYEYDSGGGEGEVTANWETTTGTARKVVGKLHPGQQNRVLVTINPNWIWRKDEVKFFAESRTMQGLRITKAWVVHGEYTGPGRQ